MFNFGNFAGGLAQGLRSGGEMEIRRKAAERLAKADEREAEMHEAGMDKARFKQDKRERLRAANEEIVSGWEPEEEGWTAAPANPGPEESGFAPGNPLGSAETGPPSSPAAGLSRAGGLQPKLPSVAFAPSTTFAATSDMTPDMAGIPESAGLMSHYSRTADPAGAQTRQPMKRSRAAC